MFRTLIVTGLIAAAGLSMAGKAEADTGTGSTGTGLGSGLSSIGTDISSVVTQGTSLATQVIDQGVTDGQTILTNVTTDVGLGVSALGQIPGVISSTLGQVTSSLGNLGGTGSTTSQVTGGTTP